MILVNKILAKFLSEDILIKRKLQKQYWHFFINRDNTDSGIWARVEKNSFASKDGLYIFKCIGDDNYNYELHELKAGDSLHLPFTGNNIHGNDSYPIVPISYYVIPTIEGQGWIRFEEDAPSVDDSLHSFGINKFSILAIKDGRHIVYHKASNASKYIRYSPFLEDMVHVQYYEYIWSNPDAVLIGFYDIENLFAPL